MVAAEELYALRPVLARELLERLWEHFDAVSDTVKGDILYLAGEIGGTTALEKITAVLTDTTSADVSEAAAEALEKLK